MQTKNEIEKNLKKNECLVNTGGICRACRKICLHAWRGKNIGETRGAAVTHGQSGWSNLLMWGSK